MTEKTKGTMGIIKRSHTWISFILSIISLLVVLGGSFFWIANIENDIANIKDNHLYHLDLKVDTVMKDVDKIEGNVSIIQVDIGEIKGYLKK